MLGNILLNLGNILLNIHGSYIVGMMPKLNKSISIIVFFKEFQSNFKFVFFKIGLEICLHFVHLLDVMY